VGIDPRDLSNVPRPKRQWLMLVDPANTMTELLRFSVNLTQKLRIASLRAASAKKRRFLNRAKIQRPTICTPTSTLDLSLWMIWACWRYGGAVMTGEIRVGAVTIGSWKHARVTPALRTSCRPPSPRRPP